MDTREAVDRYLAAKKPSWAETTFINRKYHLDHFAEACPELPETPEPIEAFLASIPGPLYRYHHWCTIRAMYRWGQEKKRFRVKNPCPQVEPPPKPKTEPYWLEEDELVTLLQHPSHSKRDRTLLYLLADTGMRIGEAHSMTVENMRDGWVYVTGKTGPRWVPVSPAVMAMLRAIAPPSGPFWRGKRGVMTKNGLQMAVRVAFARAGFVGEKMSPHRLRHTFCTIWNGPDADGMDIVGHKTWGIWRQYKHVRRPRLAQAHQQHGPLAQLRLV